MCTEFQVVHRVQPSRCQVPVKQQTVVRRISRVSTVRVSVKVHEPNGVAERAARRIKEGTAATLVLCGLSDEWWSEPIYSCLSMRQVILCTF